ncbi:MAG: hypothetical protein AAF485_29110 [Chloroflexota bacterium]
MHPCIPIIAAAALIIIANVLPVLVALVSPGFTTVGWVVYFVTIPASFVVLLIGLGGTLYLANPTQSCSPLTPIAVWVLIANILPIFVLLALRESAGAVVGKTYFVIIPGSFVALLVGLIWTWILIF